MPQTANKGYEIQTTGTNSGTWGDVLNTQMISYVDDNLGGLAALTLSNVNVVLTATQARQCMLRLTGTISAAIQVTTACIGIFLVENLTTGAFTVTISNGVNAVPIPTSRRAVLYADPVNGVRVISMAADQGPELLPKGTVIVFFQASAPVGWTKSTSFNDSGLRVTSGAGGGSFGSVPFSTVFATTQVGTLQLNSNQVPQLSTVALQAGSGAQAAGPYTGVGSPHTHALDLRLQYIDVILATRT